MKGKIILAGNALVLGVFAACSWSADPYPNMDVDVTILADGVEHQADKDAAAIPADTLQMRVLAKVTAPPGDWQLTLEVDGALSLQGANNAAGTQPSALQRAVHTVRDDEPVEVLVTAYPQPTGEAIIRASLPTLTKTFRFQIAPVVPALSICRPSPNGGCETPGAGPDPDTPTDEERVHWLPFPSSPGADLQSGSLRDGEPALLVVTTTPSADRKGVSWTGNVTTDGVLSLIDGDKLVKSRTIDFNADSGPLYVPARVTGAGAGSAFAQVSSGPKASLFIKTSSAAVAPRRIEFVDHVGLRARNRVTLCSSRPAGALTVSLGFVGDAGSTVLSSQVPLSVVPGGPCAEPYPGLANFVWVGSEAAPIWTVKDDVSGAGAAITVPMLGTEVTAVEARNVSLSWLTDAGVDGGAKGALAQVTGSLWRNAFGQDGGPAAEPLANTVVAVKDLDGLTADPSSFTTDANGQFSFTLTKELWLGAALILVEIDHRVTLQLLDLKP